MKDFDRLCEWVGCYRQSVRNPNTWVSHQSGEVFFINGCCTPAGAVAVLERMSETTPCGYQTIRQGVRGHFVYYGKLPSPVSSVHIWSVVEGSDFCTAVRDAALAARPWEEQ